MPNVVFSAALQAPIALAPPAAALVAAGGVSAVIAQANPIPGDAALLIAGLASRLGLALGPAATAVASFAGQLATRTPGLVTLPNPPAGAASLAGAAPSLAVSGSGSLNFLWPDPLPEATANAPYYYRLQGTGGVPPYTFGVTTVLPAGLSLNASTGELTGTPVATVTLDPENFTLTDSS